MQSALQDALPGCVQFQDFWRSGFLAKFVFVMSFYWEYGGFKQANARSNCEWIGKHVNS